MFRVFSFCIFYYFSYLLHSRDLLLLGNHLLLLQRNQLLGPTPPNDQTGDVLLELDHDNHVRINRLLHRNVQHLVELLHLWGVKLPHLQLATVQNAEGNLSLEAQPAVLTIPSDVLANLPELLGKVIRSKYRDLVVLDTIVLVHGRVAVDRSHVNESLDQPKVLLVRLLVGNPRGKLKPLEVLVNNVSSASQKRLVVKPPHRAQHVLDSHRDDRLRVLHRLLLLVSDTDSA